jgi:hypothetical protein
MLPKYWNLMLQHCLLSARGPRGEAPHRFVDDALGNHGT